MLIRNIDKEFEQNTKFLDTIDFTLYFSQTNSLAALMALVESDYECYSLLPECLDGSAFNYYTEEDLKDYLKKRYPNLMCCPVEDYYIQYDTKNY